MKALKMFWSGALGPRSYIWATWAQKAYPAISPEPCLQFSQTRASFSQKWWDEFNKIMKRKKFIDVGVWDLETAPRPLWPRRLPSHQSGMLTSIFKIKTSFSQESWDESNKILNLKKIIGLGVWGLETTFGSLGPTSCLNQAISPEPIQIFTNGASFSQEFFVIL